MRTEISHKHTWGFLLSEEELRRIVQSAQEHAAKVGTNLGTKFQAKLRDGSLIDSDKLDDILSLENGGQKAVTRLSLSCGDSPEHNKASISVEFEDARKNATSWNSIVIAITGESRDAVFVAAADLEERVKKTRTV